jgi:hypothetical protein
MLRWYGILMVGYICLVFMMFHVEHRLSDSLADRRLHLTTSLHKANMPTEQVSALLDAIDGVEQDAYSALIFVFLPMGVLIPPAFAEIYEIHRRLKKLESTTQQPSPALQTDGGSP